jgi:hypothetical protein
MRKILTVFFVVTCFLSLGFKDIRHFRGGSERVGANVNKYITPSKVPVWQTWAFMSPLAMTSSYTLTIYHNSTYTDSTLHTFTGPLLGAMQTPVLGSRCYRYRVNVPNVASAYLTLVWGG